jgi:hypothetical protein
MALTEATTMQRTRVSKVPSRKAAGRGTIAGPTLDNDARWRFAAELVETLRRAGYDCELLVEQTGAGPKPNSAKSLQRRADFMDYIKTR